jgi:aquaporin Z
MVSASFFGVLLFHPTSPTAHLGFVTRNLLMGLAMGATAVGIIMSPWGRRSGAHFNPAVTLSFLRLGRIGARDAVFYILFQFGGGLVGALLSSLVLQDLLADGAVNYVVTVPGSHGWGVAFGAEVIISFVMMTTILFTSNTARSQRLTPLLAGALVATFIAVESPISGMSMNPARTIASAIVASDWTGWWIYFVAPTIAMLAASEFFLRTQGLKSASGRKTLQPRCREESPLTAEENNLSASATLR